MTFKGRQGHQKCHGSIERINDVLLPFHTNWPYLESFPTYNNNNKHIYRAPCMPTEGCRGAGEVSVRRSGDSY